MEENEQTFSVLDSKGLKTIAFAIENDTVDKKEVFTLKLLDIVSEEEFEDKSKRKFSIETDKDVTVLMLTLGKNKVVLNTGLLSSNKMQLIKKPSMLKYEPIVPKEKNFAVKEFKYTENLKRPISIIDVETCKEVIPTVYLDKKTGNVVGKCEMTPYKAYIALELLKE